MNWLIAWGIALWSPPLTMVDDEIAAFVRGTNADWSRTAKARGVEVSMRGSYGVIVGRERMSTQAWLALRESEAAQLRAGSGWRDADAPSPWRTLGQPNLGFSTLEVRVSTGAPLRAIEGRIIRDRLVEGSMPETRIAHGAAMLDEGGLPRLLGAIRLPVPNTWGGPYRPLPLIPRWPAFALNTLVYASAISVPVIVGRWAVRFARLHRARCMECGYPIAGSARCPECGIEHAPSKQPVVTRGVHA